jgi:hypothetical protein
LYPVSALARNANGAPTCIVIARREIALLAD